MSENKEILEKENQNLTEQNTENTENLAEEKTAEEILAEEKDRYIRLYAEFENFKKRTQKEKFEFFQYANQEFITVLLPVLDDFERALKQIGNNENQESQNLKGIELIYQKLSNTLKDKGLKQIEIHPGDDFNVDFHEAITQIPAPTPELKGKIIDVIETGYTLHDKVIRFAKVVTGEV